MKQHNLAMFGLVDILVEYTLTMIGFQGLITELEAPSSDPESQSWSKSISGPFQQAQIWLDILSRYDMLIPVPTVGLHHQTLKAIMVKVHLKILLRTHTTKLRCSIMEY
ncbi:hypothetical protein EVAR_99769_1 [Eumeta japonica]|uniref:Uncharacterized protein n=1 Tax=Eumeta variegata TaxID=151549 RepID=A0A4C1SC49_EUMVA|nr:hypothetical protein EVAR_99769_1 [Eumeta japonica]